MYYRKNNGSKILSGILAVLLVLVIAAGVVGVGYMSDWFTDWTKFEQEQPADEEQGSETASAGGAIIGESVGSGVSLMSAKIATADYAANGVSTMAETAYTLTATITPVDASNKAVDWSVEFVNPSSSWANGKTVTDYVTVTPTSDGALKATVECKGAFGEQIKVVCTSRENSEKSASCTVDYAKKITGVSFSLLKDGLPDTDIDFSTAGFDYEIVATPSYSVYTISDDFEVDISFKGTEEFLDHLCSYDYGFGVIQFPVLELNKTDFLSNSWFLMELYEFEYVSFSPNVVNLAISEYEGDIIEVTATYTGTYSEYTATENFAIGTTDFSVYVESVSLGQTSILF